MTIFGNASTIRAQFRRTASAVLLLAALAPPAGAYQLVVDGEDPALEIRGPGFVLDKTGSYHGYYKFSAVGPGTGANLAVWTIDAIPPGTYAVEFYVDNGNFAQTAEYAVEHDSGVTTVVVSQNFVGSGWHALGNFDFNRAGRITQTDYWTGAGTKVIADALRLTLQGTPVAPTVNTVPPEINVTIDDLGALNPASPGTYTAQLFAGAPNCSYAIIPGLTYSTAVLQAAQGLGIDTILHQPMQYVGQPDTNPGDPTRLYTGMTDSQILSTLQTNLAAVSPYTRGVNNHQGSRFSQYGHGLDIVMAELRSQEHFFFDSRTITDSVGFDRAKAAGLLAVERDLFIDGSSAADTVNRVMMLAQMALYAPTHTHTGIGHQGAATVPGLLQAVATDLPTSGVGMRPISRMAKIIVETDAVPQGSSVSVAGPWTSTTADMMSQDCHDGTALELASDQAGWVRFTPDLMWAGNYRVFVGFRAGANNCTAVRVTTQAASGSHDFALNQAVEPNRWHYIGTHSFAAGTSGHVQIQPDALASAGQVVKADAVKIQYDGPPASAVAEWPLY